MGLTADSVFLSNRDIAVTINYQLQNSLLSQRLNGNDVVFWPDGLNWNCLNRLMSLLTAR